MFADCCLMFIPTKSSIASVGCFFFFLMSTQRQVKQLQPTQPKPVKEDADNREDLRKQRQYLESYLQSLHREYTSPELKDPSSPFTTLLRGSSSSNTLCKYSSRHAYSYFQPIYAFTDLNNDLYRLTVIVAFGEELKHLVLKMMFLNTQIHLRQADGFLQMLARYSFG